MKKLKQILGIVSIIVIIIFLGLYFAYQNGYYEKITRDKIMLTNKQIEKFEEDIINGKDVTIDDYVEETKDYSTKTSKMSLSLSGKIENVFDKGIKYLFRKIAKVVE